MIWIEAVILVEKDVFFFGRFGREHDILTPGPTSTGETHDDERKEAVENMDDTMMEQRDWRWAL